MIDVENEIFTKVATELRTQFPKVNVYGEDVRVLRLSHVSASWKPIIIRLNERKTPGATKITPI